ncbi:PREDICTED: uncharacterized protein LOC105144674 [Acromyrmex echinatior]|uniref:uncharacterized protein LOC105144674 n=1 Tax=Acromyrmex echinatior TaxID=103372 RepID=UPI000580D4F2|nr:PREDICTED: uncharacterized protein LOC105144674 [Acromyrmex echinatior]
MQTYKKLEDQIQRKTIMFLRKLQEILQESGGQSRDLNESGNATQSFSRRNPTFPHTNVRDDITRDYICYRCKHFLEIPRNLSSQPFSDGVPTFIEQCKNELNFIQAIVWLKSSIACVSKIPVKQLQQIFNEQWNTCDEYNYSEDECTDIEQLRSMDKIVSSKNTIVTSTPLNICDIPCITPQRTIRNLYSRSKDPRSKPLNSMSANDLNESVESLTLGNSNSHYIAARKKKKNVKCYIIPETDTESILNDDTYYDLHEHQPSFEFEKNTECSMKTTSKNDIHQKNKKIIENKYIFQKSHAADVSSEYNLPARNQSNIDPMFKYNGEFDESFISSKSQNDVANKVDYIANKVEFDSRCLTNIVITPKNVSQMSNARNEYFEFLLDGNSPCQVSNISVGCTQDSAYSTSRNDVFNIAVEAGSIIGNKRVPDIEHNYELQPCKKKTITKNCEFQETRSLFSSDEQMSDTNSKNLDDVGVTARSIIGNKCTKNIEHCYELQPRNEKTFTCQKVTFPSSITQKAVISHTNIKHCYNLRSSNNRKISQEEEVSFARIQEHKKHKLERIKNLSEGENENKDEIISANWLNFSVESLHMEGIILASIRVILSTLCDKRMVEVYMMRQQRRNTRNYWKSSWEEEAVKAVLNISDIFTKEEKPNICIKIIIMKIVKTLNEIMMWGGQLHKINCTQVYITIQYTFFIFTKKIQKNCVLIEQLHLIFYALNIILRKYRTIISSNQRPRSAEKVIPHVEDLWKVYYINKELKHAGLDVDTAEKQWLNVLENSTETFMNFGFTKFAKESFSLVHILI